MSIEKKKATTKLLNTWGMNIEKKKTTTNKKRKAYLTLPKN